MNLNLSQNFIDYAKSKPNKIAFISPVKYDANGIIEEKVTNYGDMLQKVANYRAGLLEAGFKKGDRLIILTPINLEFYAFMMACLSLGLVAVFLDPGIGVKKILTAISDSNAKAIISLKKVLKYWPFVPQLWSKKRYSSDKKVLGVNLLSDLYIENASTDFEAQTLDPNDHVLITFTSGSTGRSKGADRNALNVFNQINLIKELWVCDEDQIDLPIFLMFGFMNLLYGITTVLPAAEYHSIGEISPRVIVSQIKKWKITRMSGSYTFSNKLISYLVENDETITSIKNIVLGGTPVTKEFCEKMEKAFPDSKNIMTYGSTECAPISFCEINDLINENIAGSLVGRPCQGLTVSIVNLPADHEITFDDKEATPFQVKAGDWGEVIVKGPHVVKKYVENPKADKKNKIQTPSGDVWHRTGDTGYFDKEGSLILTGRVSDLVKYNGQYVQPLIVESKFDSVDGIDRSAIIQKGKDVFLVLQSLNPSIIKAEVNKILSQFNLDDIDLKYVEKIPLDDRHNSKINRIKLKSLV